LDIYSASSLRQQSVCKYIAPLWHIIAIPSQPILYSYLPCWSVTRRFVSQRKVRSPDGLPEGDLTFRGETNRRVTLQQGW
jgi:hypothetical protein